MRRDTGAQQQADHGPHIAARFDAGESSFPALDELRRFAEADVVGTCDKLDDHAAPATACTDVPLPTFGNHQPGHDS